MDTCEILVCKYGLVVCKYEVVGYYRCEWGGHLLQHHRFHSCPLFAQSGGALIWGNLSASDASCIHPPSRCSCAMTVPRCFHRCRWVWNRNGCELYSVHHTWVATTDCWWTIIILYLLAGRIALDMPYACTKLYSAWVCVLNHNTYYRCLEMVLKEMPRYITGTSFGCTYVTQPSGDAAKLSFWWATLQAQRSSHNLTNEWKMHFSTLQSHLLHRYYRGHGGSFCVYVHSHPTELKESVSF